MNAYALLLLLTPAPAVVGDHVYVEREIHLGSELAAWCRDEAEARVIAMGSTPYQWRASFHDRDRLLHVEGTLRFDGKDVGVRCRIARGARERYASFEFIEQA